MTIGQSKLYHRRACDPQHRLRPPQTVCSILKSPISSFLVAYRRDVRVLFSSSATINEEPVSSSTTLRSIHGDHPHQHKGGSPENSISEWQQEPETASASREPEDQQDYGS